MFTAQVVATTFSCFIQIAVLNFALGSIEDVCDIRQRDRFTCPGGRVFFAGKFFTFRPLSSHTAPVCIILPVPGTTPACLCTPAVFTLSTLTPCLTRLTSVRHMGADRPVAHVLTRQHLLWPLHLLHHWRHRSRCDLHVGQAMAQLACKVPHGAAHLWRCWCYPSRYATQLLLLGHGGFRFPVLVKESVQRLVDTPQLLDLVCSGPWTRVWYPVSLLCVYDS